MRIDQPALAYAVTLEAMLAAAAVFRGPHGAFGAIPWMLNLPGIIVVLAVSGERLFVARAALAALIQVTLWYAIFAFVRKRRRAARASRVR